MKIAVFSDIHGNLQALEAIVADINKNNFDEVICLGDAIAMGPNPKECLDLIIDNDYKMILGNHELYYLKGTQIDDEMGEGEIKHQKWIKEQLKDDYIDFLNKCPIKIEITKNNIKMLFQHFLIDDNSKDEYPFVDLSIVKDDRVSEQFDKIDTKYMFIGHEHKSFEVELNNKKLFDAGSSGCRKDDKTFYTIITIENDVVNIEKKYLIYDRDQFVSTVKNIEYPDREIISKIFFGLNDL